MRLFFSFIFLLFIGCNFPNNKSIKQYSDSIKKSEEFNMYMNKISKSIKSYNNDTLRINHKIIYLGNYKIKVKKKYYIIKSLSEAKEIFSYCDSVTNIDFDKYALIGVERSTNGSEKIISAVFSIPSKKSIIVNITVIFYALEQNITGRYKIWLLVEKPYSDWEINVLIHEKTFE